MLLLSARVAEQHVLSMPQDTAPEAVDESPASAGSQYFAVAVKRLVDVVVAGAALCVLAPLFLLIACACKLDGGPALFGHRRIGFGGASFKCLKFRTMTVDADRVLQDALAKDPALLQEWTATRKLRNDPRVTRVGRLLRMTSLDELPQLINILRRDMSLVGPRPIVEAEIGFYGSQIGRYYSVRPGLTGLWQVSGRSTTTYDRRVELDSWYVDHWTLRLDAMVVLKTIPALLSRDGAY